MSFGEVFGKNRQVIPRWHTYAMARWLGVTTSSESATREVNRDEDYLERVRSWQKTGKMARAAELVGNALVRNYLDDEVAIKAADFILQNRRKVSSSLLEVAETFLRLARKKPFPLPDVIVPEESERFYSFIGDLKARAREYPRNPILWMDLAFYYSAVGQTRSAENAVKVALSLNKENRYLLRSASRFYMHIGSPECALHFLRQSNIGKYDPWLVAAEVAISDTLEFPSKLIKVAKGMIQGGEIAPFHLSELASALGTIELKHGARKKGKKLLAVALEDPTENAVAQATFLLGLDEEFRNFVSPRAPAQSFEAATRLNFYNQRFQEALESAKKWFAYQPFSSRPAVLGSYVASVALGQFEEAIKIAKMGQLSSPDDFMLKNNIAFSLASLNRFAAAREALVPVIESGLTESERHVLAATRGVIEFRSGNSDEGRKLYRAALEFFKKEKDFHSEAIAKFFWAREERIAKGPGAESLHEEAVTAAKTLNMNELLTQPAK